MLCLGNILCYMVRFSIYVAILDMTVPQNSSQPLVNNSSCPTKNSSTLDFHPFEDNSMKTQDVSFNWTTSEIAQIEASFFYGYEDMGTNRSYIYLFKVTPLASAQWAFLPMCSAPGMTKTSQKKSKVRSQKSWLFVKAKKSNVKSHDFFSNPKSQKSKKSKWLLTFMTFSKKSKVIKVKSFFVN